MASREHQAGMPMNKSPAPVRLEPESLVGLKDAGAGQNRHPIDAIQGKKSACKETLRDSVYGGALNARISIESHLLNRVERLPGFTSSKLGLESLTGSLDDFDFGSYLPSVEEKSLEGALGDKHVDMLERKFGL